MTQLSGTEEDMQHLMSLAPDDLIAMDITPLVEGFKMSIMQRLHGMGMGPYRSMPM